MAVQGNDPRLYVANTASGEFEQIAGSRPQVGVHICGGRSSGKTSMALAIAELLARHGVAVYFDSRRLGVKGSERLHQQLAAGMIEPKPATWAARWRWLRRMAVHGLARALNIDIQPAGLAGQLLHSPGFSARIIDD